MRPSEVLAVFQSSGSLLDGHFLLSSGLHSRQYLQCASVLQHPTLSSRLCGALARGFEADDISVVAGPALGGIVVAYELARALGCRSVFAERVDGRLILRRGFHVGPEDRVLIAEDVVTTGGSSQELIELVQNTGATVVGVGSLVDRSGGTVDFPVKFHSLISLSLKTFTNSECPLCKEGVPLTKPGSRTHVTPRPSF